MIVQMSDEQYFAEDRLSSSAVRRILSCPAKFKVPIEETDSMRFGKLVHSLVLEPETFDFRYAVAPECDRRTNEGKRIWSEFVLRSNDKIVISHSEHSEAVRVSDAALSHEFSGSDVRRFLADKDTRKEVCIFWEQEFPGLGIIPCKAKLDTWNPRLKIVLDLKTCREADPNGFGRVMYNERDGYYIQDRFYLMPEETKDFQFFFLAVEKSEPYCSGVYSCDKSVYPEADERILEAAEIWKHGQETKIWSRQYNIYPQELIPPGWFWIKQK